MKKLVVFLVAIVAVTKSLSAQNSDTLQVKIVPFGKAENVPDLKTPAPNLTEKFAGRVAGIISYQTTNVPKTDSTQFFINCGCPSSYRTEPLILIDGVEVSTNELAQLQPEDIESFSILKDATVTTIYGARGTNGVIIITTKLVSKKMIEHENSAITETEIPSGVDLVIAQISDADIPASEIETEIVEKETEDFFPDLKIYPNPFSGTLRLAGAEGSTLRVISEDGIVVHTQKVSSPNEIIRLEHLRIGAYYFCVENGKQAKSVKGVKSN